MYLQDLIFTLQKFWADRGCVIEQPVDVEVGAGTFHPATFLRVLGPEPWNAAFVQFCRRPSDGRYGENPNRAGAYYQFQVGLKPSPLEVQDLYLDSLRAADLAFRAFDTYEGECKRLLERGLVLPAYEFCMKSSHAFNSLDARGAISVTERARFIGRVRAMARACAHAYVGSRAKLGFPLLPAQLRAQATAAFEGVGEAGVNAGALAAARAIATHAEEMPHAG